MACPWSWPPPNRGLPASRSLRLPGTAWRAMTSSPPPATVATPAGRAPLPAGSVAAVAAVAVLGAGTAAVLSQRGPAPRVVALTATDVVPQSSGRAEIRDTPSGFEITLEVQGLPPAAPGTYYQGWLKNAAGGLVTIGTFHARQGGQDIILWSGVDPSAYPKPTRHSQQEGQGAQSSGVVVLKGAVG